VSAEIFPSTRSSANLRRWAWLLKGISHGTAGTILHGGAEVNGGISTTPFTPDTPLEAQMATSATVFEGRANTAT
jgi:hypothetical protein